MFSRLRKGKLLENILKYVLSMVMDMRLSADADFSWHILFLIVTYVYIAQVNIIWRNYLFIDSSLHVFPFCFEYNSIGNGLMI